MSSQSSVPAFWTPPQDPPAGAPMEPESSHLPILFKPLTLRGTTFKNRIFVSPMCQYSAVDGHMTFWHKQHLGSLSARGAGLVITEVMAITPEGRISPEDAGIWKDSQMEPLKEIVEFAHSQGTKIAAQVGHAGRKASTVAPWKGREVGANKEQNGWEGNILGPSTVGYGMGTFKPKQMTLEEIEKFKEDWAAAVKRILAVGFDSINIHAAHGYLLNEFLSPKSNIRTDQYGGSFENRIRLLLEIVDLTRSIVPADYPLLLRVNGTDYMYFDETKPQWHIDEAVKLGQLLAEKGIDLIDVSGGGNDPDMKANARPAYQAEWAKQIKDGIRNTKTAVSAVGMITSGKLANYLIDNGDVDVVMVARGFLKDPNLVRTWADELDLKVWVASQYGWGEGIKRPLKNSL